MSKQIWLGPLLGKNRSRLIERCAELVSRGESGSFLYLAASSPLLEVVSEGILDGRTNHGLWGELPVYLFRGFVRHILATATDRETALLLPSRLPIDREELPLKRSLVSQILQRLKNEGKLRAIAPLAGSDGCVNTVATLIGEIQRAGKTPAELREIVTQRAAEEHLSQADQDESDTRPIRQADFDHEIALVYEIYSRLLEANQLTEDDANGLRALRILQGELDGRPVVVPWLEKSKLLVLDGFFDFTPVQGEMLRLLIPRFPEVIVNLNKDERNPEIFKPFEDTINQLCAIADFRIEHNTEVVPVSGVLGPLRERLFNPNTPAELPADQTQSEIRYFDCTDRETEVRTIAKEIKRLVLLEQYKLSEIALVVRERESYAETIVRVMREESLPCNLDRRMVAAQIPAARAVIKLLAVLDDLARDESNVLKMPQLADQIKSGYFRLSKEELLEIAADFDQRYTHLLVESDNTDRQRIEHARRDAGVGFWNADALENIIAYVGAELRLHDWLERCRQLIALLPGAEATKELLHIDAAEPGSDDDEAQLEDAETVQKEDRQTDKKRRPQRDVSLAAIAWATLVIKRWAMKIQSVPRVGQPEELRAGLLKILGQLQFREQVSRPLRHTTAAELPRATLDLHALEALRRAMLTTVKSIQLTRGEDPGPIRLTTFIDEMRRSLGSQTVTLGSAQRGGLHVLEATDVRGLRFRALFAAGLVEGGFPLGTSRDWIYPHEERERLKRYGLILEDISPETLLKEEHYFYQVACRTTERLYLTRPLVLEGDNETVASYYIDEVRRAISPAQIAKEEVARPDYNGQRLERVSSSREVAVGLIRNQQRYFGRVDIKGLLPKPEIENLLTQARDEGFLGDSAWERVATERERAGRSFGPYDGEITNPDLLALIDRRFGNDVVYSASGLSTFGNCPYRFFAQKVLKLEPRGEAALDLQALDAGMLLHDILRRFFEKHREERLDPDRRDELTAELLRIADEVFDQHQRIVPPLNRQVWKLDRAIRKIILEQVLLFELEVQEKTAAQRVAPARFELAFGSTQSAAKDPNSIETPLQLKRATAAGEDVINISGQIDRVDIAQDNTIAAYDYKLSRGASREDMLEGRNLQIPIYLEALEQLFFPNHPIAGGGFYTLRGGIERRNTGMYRSTMNDYLGLKTSIKSVISDSDWQSFRAAVTARIWEFFDSIRAGRFIVKPSEGKDSCKFCDYAAVCRYERYRIEGKNR